jgi:hypothetical protein
MRDMSSPPRFETTLLDEVRRTAQAFVRVIEHAGGLGHEVLTSVRATCDLADRPSEEQPLVLAFVGDAAADRHALLNAAIGEPLLGDAGRRDARVTIVRRAAALEYVAHSRSGRRIVRFTQRMPDRGPDLEKSLARAVYDIDAATTAAQSLRARFEEARARADAASSLEREADVALERARVEGARSHEALGSAAEDRARCEAVVRAAPAPPDFLTARPPWWAVWMWFLWLVFWPVWRGRMRSRTAGEAESTRAGETLELRRSSAEAAEARLRAAEEKHAGAAAAAHVQREAAATLEREVADTHVLDEANERAKKLREEHAAHESERKQAFLAHLRAFDADDLAELAIDYPGARLPDGVTLVDVPAPSNAEAERVARSAVGRDANALVLVADAASPPSAAVKSLVDQLGRSVPLVRVVRTRGGRPVDDAATLIQRIHAERAVVVGTRAAMLMRSFVGELSRARGAAEAAHRKRLDALESQRIPDPTQFRAAQMARVGSAIEQGADDVLRSATALVHDLLLGLASEWKEPIAAATSRGAVEAQVKAMSEAAAARIADVFERVSEHVARELQQVAESLETWALEEIHARYQVARRFGIEELSPVVSELTRDDLQRELAASPVEGALGAFEKQRVGYGIGGAATGALLGTLIFPGIGTAIGAFVGVFAGFLKGIDSLKQDCFDKIDATLSATEAHSLEQLRGKRPDFARVIALSVEEALGEALQRLEDAISRLMAVEKRTIERERSTLAQLDDARSSLEEHDNQLAKLIEAAMKRLGCDGLTVPS